MSSKETLLSVIIPVHNGSAFLEEAVSSVHSQDHTPLEVLIIDDGSSDASGKVAQSLNGSVEYIYQDQQGPAAARNVGLALAKGTVIGFLDVDDLWPSNKIHNQLPLLLANTTLDFVMGKVLYFNSHASSLAPPSSDSAERLHLGAGLFRREIFDKVGKFNESLKHWEDLDWFLRAHELEASYQENGQISLRYRMREDSLSGQASETIAHQQLLQVLHESTKRRRGKGKL